MENSIGLLKKFKEHWNDRYFLQYLFFLWNMIFILYYTKIIIYTFLGLIFFCKINSKLNN
jgi:hypothetical protein